MRTPILPMLLFAVVLAACSTPPSGQTYSRNQTRTSFDVTYGEVLAIRVVELEGYSTAIGSWGGAAVGHAVATTSAGGSWQTSSVAGAVGGVAGAIAGEALERKLREGEALEITVKVDNAGEIAIVQADDVVFTPGDRVRVLLGRDGSARVSAL